MNAQINKSLAPAINEQELTSLAIAEITGKQHFHVMRDIRKMEKAWVKSNASKFGLVKHQDKKGEWRDMYEFTLEEYMYVISGYDNYKRAKLTKFAFAAKEALLQQSPAEDEIRARMENNSREMRRLNDRKNRLKKQNEHLRSALRHLGATNHYLPVEYQFKRLEGGTQ